VPDDHYVRIELKQRDPTFESSFPFVNLLGVVHHLLLFYKKKKKKAVNKDSIIIPPYTYLVWEQILSCWIDLQAFLSFL
jgi:hypothetical protein